jgi:hypothetical protein
VVEKLNFIYLLDKDFSSKSKIKENEEILIGNVKGKQNLGVFLEVGQA